jgi:RNA polymerase sigma factor (sigma-70 family)
MSQMAGKIRHRESSMEIPDARLFERMRDGDMGALGILFDRYAQDIRRVIARLGIAPADVDDLVQLTFLDALRSADQYDGRVNAKPWLAGIAVMMVRRHRRSLGKLVQRLAEWARQPAPNEQEASPSDAYEMNEMARKAEQALAKLSAKKREVFILVVMEGLPGEQVAAALSIPVATVWTRLHHARLDLRALLAEEAS